MGKPLDEQVYEAVRDIVGADGHIEVSEVVDVVPVLIGLAGDVAGALNVATQMAAKHQGEDIELTDIALNAAKSALACFTESMLQAQAKVLKAQQGDNPPLRVVVSQPAPANVKLN